MGGGGLINPTLALLSKISLFSNILDTAMYCDPSSRKTLRLEPEVELSWCWSRPADDLNDPDFREFSNWFLDPTKWLALNPEHEMPQILEGTSFNLPTTSNHIQQFHSQDLQSALRPSAVSFGACINALGRAKQWQRTLGMDSFGRRDLGDCYLEVAMNLVGKALTWIWFLLASRGFCCMDKEHVPDLCRRALIKSGVGSKLKTSNPVVFLHYTTLHVFVWTQLFFVYPIDFS